MGDIAEITRLKAEFHNAFDPFWVFEYVTRDEAYAWLARETGIREPHAGRMNEEELRICLRVCRTSSPPRSAAADTGPAPRGGSLA